jgi:hypothetical protein
MYRLQIPALASFGAGKTADPDRERALSVDGWQTARVNEGVCSCGNPHSTFHRSATAEQSLVFLSKDGIKMVGDQSVRTYTFEHKNASEKTYLMGRKESTLSEHVVFSGEK